MSTTSAPISDTIMSTTGDGTSVADKIADVRASAVSFGSCHPEQVGQLAVDTICWVTRNNGGLNSNASMISNMRRAGFVKTAALLDGTCTTCQSRVTVSSFSSRSLIKCFAGRSIASVRNDDTKSTSGLSPGTI